MGTWTEGLNNIYEILDDSDVSDLSDDDSDSDHDYIFSDSSSSSDEGGGEVPSPRKWPSVLETNHDVPWLSSGSRKRSIHHPTIDGELQSAPPAKRGRGRPPASSPSRGRGRGRARGRWSGRGRACGGQAPSETPNRWQWKPTCDFTPSIFDVDDSYEDMGGCTNPELTQQSYACVREASSEERS